MTAQIFGTPGCTYCGAAKRLLDSNSITYSYTDITVGTNKEDLESRIGKTVTSVPQIILNDEYIGGFTELQAKLKEWHK
jgi:glutaredoxin 1